MGAPLLGPRILVAVLIAVLLKDSDLLDLPARVLSRFGQDDLEATQELAGRSSLEGTSQPDAQLHLSKNGFVLIVSPARPGSEASLEPGWLQTWLLTAEASAWLRGAFFQHGAIVFRGFNVPDAPSFEQVALAITPSLEDVYLGTSPRSQINQTKFVHTAADFDKHSTVPPHLEMSFMDDPPKLQMFYAHRLDMTKGGETPLVDFQGVWESISGNRGLVKRMRSRNIMYIRRYEDCGHRKILDPYFTKCWQDMFKTDNKTEVRRQCSKERFDCSWDSINILTIKNVQPPLRQHQATGKTIWFNHMNVLIPDSYAYDYERTAVMWGKVEGWWPLLIGTYYRMLLLVMRTYCQEQDLGHNVVYEDGSLVAREDFLDIKRAIWRNTVQAPYQLQDVVLADNWRVAHGREMYMGAKKDRQIMTAWSNLYPTGWLEKSTK
ncbi:unnamed protein product [Polarella glacialis]|uniref:TauD/TfdA-like domain-containing protein n=1 Tax=Polarella glacialis TaxID=89957 RepID=A0A813H4Y0_POLGL|nr:unnamed protein product [Polarella glacialis]